MSDSVGQEKRSTSQLLFTLEELIAALDRRRPQIERSGEPEIASDAMLLRGTGGRFGIVYS